MRKRIYLQAVSFIVMLMFVLPASSQNILYVHRVSEKPIVLMKDDVDSIVFTNFDENGIEQEDVQKQIIYTSDSVYVIPIADIDSVAFYSSPKYVSLCPDENHPHRIDLGLPSGTKWACCNVDAVIPEDYGGYYAWGETEEKAVYDTDFYRFLYKAEDGVERIRDIGYSICGTEYDVAYMKWGGGWQMPTHEQFDELLEHCTFQWTTLNGIKGGQFTSKTNGVSIFMPASGSCRSSLLSDFGKYGYYWSGSQGEDHDDRHNSAWNLAIGDDYLYSNYTPLIMYGESVRPVVMDNIPDPIVTTGESFDIEDTSAKVRCSYSNVPFGAVCGVEIICDKDTIRIKADGVDGTQTISVSGLKPATEYIYRAFVCAYGKSYFGKSEKFTTAMPDISGTWNCKEEHYTWAGTVRYDYYTITLNKDGSACTSEYQNPVAGSWKFNTDGTVSISLMTLATLDSNAGIEWNGKVNNMNNPTIITGSTYSWNYNFVGYFQHDSYSFEMTR